MKKCWSKIIAMFLACLMVVTMMPQGVVTAQSLGLGLKVPRPVRGMSLHISSAMEGGKVTVLDTWEGKSGDFALLSDVDLSIYGTVEAAVDVVREQMAQRVDQIVVNIHTDEENLSDLVENFRVEVLSHTGDPKYGDTLRWQYESWGVSVSGMTDGQGNYYYTLTNNIVYYTTAEEEARYEAKLQDLLSDLNLYGLDDYTKVKTVYDWICANVTYDFENLEDESYKRKFTAFAALVDGTSVCQGYALLFYRMMMELDVNARLIAGLGAGGRHAWNIVELDEYYYNLDATWDAGYSEYNFFLRSTDNFVDHVRDPEYNSADFHAIYPMSLEDYTPNAPESPVGEPCGDNLIWSFDAETGTLTITGTGPMWDFTDSYEEDPPATGYSGRNVEVLAPWLQNEQIRDSVLKVVIGAGVTTIGAYAFYNCLVLEEVDFAENCEVVSIGQSSFEGCVGLTHIDIPDGVVSIGNKAFFCNNLRDELIIPASVQTIGVEAFAYNGISMLTLVGGVEPLSIEKDAFRNSWQLKTVYLPPNVCRVENAFVTGCNQLEAFYVGPNSRYYTAVDGVLYTKDMKTLVQYPMAKSGISYIVPDGVTAIEDYAFYYANLTSISLPEGLIRIGDYAFYTCSDLPTISLPHSLQTIGYKAFYNCHNLASIWIYENVTSVGPLAFEICEALTEVYLCSETLISQFENVYSLGGLLMFASQVYIPSAITDFPAGFQASFPVATGQLTIDGQIYTIYGHEHIYNIYVDGKDASCTEDGWQTLACACGQEKYVILEATGHNHDGMRETVGREPTCAVPGQMELEVYCTNCGQGMSGNVRNIDPLGHSYDGGNCTICGAEKVTGGACGDSATWHYDEATATLYIEGNGATYDYIYEGYFWGNGDYTPWFTFADEIEIVVVGENITYLGREILYGCGNLLTMYVHSAAFVASHTNWAGFSDLIEYVHYLYIVDTITEIDEQLVCDYQHVVGVEEWNGVLYQFYVGHGPHVYLEEISPTCTEFGRESWRCSCGMTFTRDIAPTGHSKDILVESTVSCTQPGYEIFRCHCGEELRVDIPATGHVFEDNVCIFCQIIGGTCGYPLQWIFDPQTGTLTITGDGWMEYYGSMGNGKQAPWYAYRNQILHLEIADTVRSIGHEAFADCTALTSFVMPAGVYEIGYRAFANCTSLAKVIIPEGIALDGGLYGIIFENCINLTDLYIFDQNAVNAFSWWCEKSHLMDYVQQLFIPVMDYENLDMVTSFACILEPQEIEVDGVYRLQFTKKAHELKLVGSAQPSCWQDGWTDYWCSLCGSIITEWIDKLGHDYTTTVVEVTCHEDGYTLYKCSRCGDEYRDSVVDAEVEMNWIVDIAPTPTSEGSAQRSCEICGFVEKRSLPKYVPADKNYDISVLLQNALDILDIFHDELDVEFMITMTNRYFLRYFDEWRDTVCVPAAVYEAAMNMLFVADDAVINALRTLEYEGLFYDADEQMYTLHNYGGKGGVIRPREYVGFVDRGMMNITFHVFYADIRYSYLWDVLPEGVDWYDYVESLGWPETIEYNGVVYEYNGAEDTYIANLGLETCGNKYIVEINNGLVRILSREEYTQEDLPEHLHYQFRDESQVPTCAEGGYSGWACEDCGHGYVIEVFPATGHKVDLWTPGMEPTCTENGLIPFWHCENCGIYFEDDQLTIPKEDQNEEHYIIPALGHTFEQGVCIRCGEESKVGGICGDNLTWTFDEEYGVLYIRGSGEMWSYGTNGNGQQAPWYQYRESIVRLEVTDAVTGIGHEAFAGCTGITTFTMPQDVTWVGYGAFAGCTGLQELIIPPNCAWTSTYEVFLDCFNLTDVYIFSELILGKDNGWIEWSHMLDYAKVVTILAVEIVPEDVTMIFACLGEPESVTIEGLAGLRYFRGEHDYRETYYQPATCTEDEFAVYQCDNCGHQLTKYYAEAYGHEFNDRYICVHCGLAPVYMVDYPLDEDMLEVREGGFVYTPDGHQVFIALNYPIGWLGGSTLKEYVDAYGDKYFDMTHWDTLLTFMNSDGFVPLTEETYEMFRTLVTGAWGELEEDLVWYFGFKVDRPATSGECGDDLTWTLDNGVLTISGTGAMWDYWFENVAPWYDYRELIRRIDMADTVTYIGSCAFADCTALKGFIIPAELTSMGWGAFSNCTSMAELYILEGCGSWKYTQSNVFENCVNLSVIYIFEPSVLNEKLDLLIETGMFDYAQYLCILERDYDNQQLFAYFACDGQPIPYEEDDMNFLIFTKGAHSFWQTTYVPNTCVTFGYVVETCPYCQVSIHEEIDPVGHDWDESYVCRNCGDAPEYVPDALLDMSRLELGADGCYYTVDGHYQIFIAVDSPIAWLAGNTLREYVEAHGDIYFDLTYWQDLLSATNVYGFAPLTEKTIDWMLQLITGNPGWSETEEYLTYYLAIHYPRNTHVIPEHDHIWDEAGVCTICCQIRTDYVKDTEVVVEELVVNQEDQYTTETGDEVFIDMESLAQQFGVSTFGLLTKRFHGGLTTMEVGVDYWALLVSRMNSDGFVPLTEETLSWLNAFVEEQSQPGEESVAEEYLVTKAAPTYEHVYTAQVIEPTCTSSGYTLHTCTCGDTYTTDATSALGHKDNNPWDHLCDNCDEKLNDCNDSNDDGLCDICGKTTAIRGDMDGDGDVDSDDAIYLLYFTFLPEEYPVSQNGDVDGDGDVDSDDAIYLLYYTFLPDEYPLYP